MPLRSGALFGFGARSDDPMYLRESFFCTIAFFIVAVKRLFTRHLKETDMNVLDQNIRGVGHDFSQTTELGNALKQAREIVGYSVDDLAVTCGLTVLEITRIELGVDADEAKLRRIGAALQVDWTAL